jgi:Protein of unknown function (DUF3313)
MASPTAHRHRCGALLYGTTLGLALAMALAAGGCASVGAPQQSTTLAGFDQLSLQSDGTRAWHSASARSVKAVRIDPQAIRFGANVRVDESQRQALRNSLSQALATQFSAAGLRVAGNHSEAADSMAVRATITAVELANPTLNVVTTVLLFAPVSRGGLSVEIEGLDGPSQQRVAALAFSGTAGVNNVGSAFSGIGHAGLQADIAASKFVSLVTGVQPKAQTAAKSVAEAQP